MPFSGMAYIENEYLKLGVNLDWGAAISYLEHKIDRPGVNVIDDNDNGRLVQQSWYGPWTPAEDPDPDVPRSWVWNPVQGGAGIGINSITLDFSSTASTLYAKTHPALWANGGADLKYVGFFEQWITLDGPLVRIQWRYTYHGEERAYLAVEAPAVYAKPVYSQVHSYMGESPWSGDSLTSWAQWGNATDGWGHAWNPLERWAALIDPGTGWGLGVYAPDTEELTFDRWGGNNSGGFSYVSPTTYCIEPYTDGRVFDYNTVLALGTIAQIRSLFFEEAVGSVAQATHPAKPLGYPMIAAEIGERAAPATIDFPWGAVLGALSYNVYWTDDGTDPTESSNAVTGNTSTSFTHSGLPPGFYRYAVQAVNGSGVSRLGNVMGVKVREYASVCAIPTAGTYVGTQNVDLRGINFSGTIRYTLDGTVPTVDTGTVYAGLFTLSADAPVKAIGIDSEGVTGPVATFAFEITAIPLYVAANVSGGSLSLVGGSVTVTAQLQVVASVPSGVLALSGGATAIVITEAAQAVSAIVPAGTLTLVGGSVAVTATQLGSGIRAPDGSILDLRDVNNKPIPFMYL